MTIRPPSLSAALAPLLRPLVWLLLCPLCCMRLLPVLPVLDAVNARLATQHPFFSANFDDEATALIARTQSLPIDENGRVRLPDAMIEHGGLKDKIVFVGKAQKFQIWDADRYAPIEAEAIARLKARMERARGGDT